MLSVTPLLLAYLLLLFALVYLPGRAPRVQAAMRWWWFRLAFVLAVYYLVARVDAVLGLFAAALYVVLQPLHPSMADTETRDHRTK
jgi:hypothetical protein